MPLIELETWIEAPVERVFDLSRSLDLHLSSMADTGERVVAGKASGLLELGETVTWEARHFGIRQRLQVKMTELERPHRFVDEMLKGAFQSMRHVHEFREDKPGTLMRDEFYFSAPLGILGRAVEWIFLRAYMTRLLQRRNAFLKQVAERPPSALKGAS